MRKNWKILLPVCTLAATATTLVPCLTSCGSNDSWGKAIDLDEYSPEIDPLEDTPITPASTAALYLFGASNSTDLVKQDMLCSLAENEDVVWALFKDYFDMPQEDEASGLLYRAEKHECSISNLKVDYNDGAYESGTVAKISAKIKIKFVYELTSGPTEDGIAKCTVEAKYVLNKLPYQTALTGAETKHWGVMPPVDSESEPLIKTYKDWTEKLSISSSINYYASGTPDVNCSVDWTYGWRNLPTNPDDVEFGILYWPKSYYLKDSYTPNN